MTIPSIKEIIEYLNNNKVVVMPSDTIYGIFGRALNKDVENSIYNLKGRDLSKPFIILINDIEDLKIFNIEIQKEFKEKINKIWPNKITILFKCEGINFNYLHKGTNKIAFRIPKDDKLLEILKDTGPLISTSANLTGQPYAKTIEEAKNYFQDKVDLYIDGGYIEGEPSTLIEIAETGIKILRQGSVDLTNI